MKKIIFIVIGFVIILYSTLRIYPSFSSDSVLYYNGNAKSFTYYNIDKQDVFNDFKDMIPGDVRSQTLTIRVDDIKPNTKLYLKLNSDINDEIQKYLNISIYEGDNLLPIESDMAKLYTFNKPSVINIKIVIEVPIEVDNVVNNAASTMKWSFMIEEDGEIIEAPLTYDGFNMTLYISLIIISSIMIILLLFFSRKKKEA